MFQILLDHWESLTQIVLFVGTAVSLYYSMGGRIDKLCDQIESENKQHEMQRVAMEERMKTVEQWIQSHTNDSLPHVNCPAHSTSIVDISARLDRIQDDIRELRDEFRGINKAIFEIVRKS